MVQIIRQIIVTALGGVTVLIVITFVNWMAGGGLIRALGGLTEGDVAVPEGVVVMTDKKCSELEGDWDVYGKAGGRFPIAAGHTKDSAGDSREFKVGDPEGGAYAHILTVDEMPSHKHPLKEWRRDRRRSNCDGGCQGVRKRRFDHETEATGGGQPHENTPPYVVLNFCRKN